MEKTQKIVIFLLVMSILLSTVSVIVSLSALNINLPDIRPTHRSDEGGSNGQITLIVEKAPDSGGG